MDAREMSALIGTLVFLEPVHGLRVLCEIKNVKYSYGHSRVEVSPLSGRGSAWVNADSVASAAENQEVAHVG